MSKKQFIELADCLRARLATIAEKYARSPLYLTVAQNETWETIRALADVCAADNPRFNRQRWIEYIAGKVGPNGGQK
jgi:predicted transcriptional regulator